MKSAQPLTQGTQRNRRARVAGVGAPGGAPAATATPPPVAPKLTRLFQPKIVVPRAPSTDPVVLERERLVAMLLLAEGRHAISAAAEAIVRAGHGLPETQEVHLQLLEHSDEARVREAIAALDAILSREPARRRPVLEQRLRGIEQYADEPATRDAATALRRKL